MFHCNRSWMNFFHSSTRRPNGRRPNVLAPKRRRPNGGAQKSRTPARTIRLKSSLEVCVGVMSCFIASPSKKCHLIEQQRVTSARYKSHPNKFQKKKMSDFQSTTEIHSKSDKETVTTHEYLLPTIPDGNKYSQVVVAPVCC